MLEGGDQNLIFDDQDGIKHFVNVTERKGHSTCHALGDEAWKVIINTKLTTAKCDTYARLAQEKELM